jgi:hypothetical protein
VLHPTNLGLGVNFYKDEPSRNEALGKGGMKYEKNEIHEAMEVFDGKVDFPAPHGGCIIGHLGGPYQELSVKRVIDPNDGSEQFMLRIETGKHDDGTDHIQKVVYCY